MANSKISIETIVDDKGSLKRVSKDAKKAGSSVRNYDRGIKGAANATSNSTKAFSKMSQGISGGLVGAYATLAANIFAVSAAFNFLKRAADVSILQKSQDTYARTTGVGLSNISKSLRETSGGMLDLRKSSEAAAIGMAKGFSPEQLRKLTEGAKKASVALGRNFEDSFDRLLRGTSKAEPELLDELGITLRLETATNSYAQAIGKTAKELTTFERSQAVLIETQRQLDEQFGQIEAEANPFVKLSVTFDNFVRNFTDLFLPAISGFANIINDSLPSAIAVFAGLGLSILKSVPIFDNLKNSVKEWGDSTVKNVDKAEKRARRYTRVLEKQLQKQREITDSAKRSSSSVASQMVSQGSTSKLVGRLAGGETLTNAQAGQLKKALADAEKNVNEFGVVTKGVFKDVNRALVREMRTALVEVQVATEQTTSKITQKWITVQVKFSVVAAKMRATWAAAMTSMAAGVNKVSSAFGKLIRIMSGVGIAVLVGEGLKSLKENLSSIIGGMLAIVDKAKQMAGFQSDLENEFKESDFGKMLKDQEDADKAADKLDKRFSDIKLGIEGLDLQLFVKGIHDAEGAAKSLKLANTLATSGIVDSAKEISRVFNDNPKKAKELGEELKKAMMPLRTLIGDVDFEKLFIELETGGAAGFIALETAALAATSSNAAYTNSLEPLEAALTGITTGGFLKLETLLKEIKDKAESADSSLGKFGGNFNKVRDANSKLLFGLDATIRKMELFREKTEELANQENRLAIIRSASAQEGTIASAALSRSLNIEQKRLEVAKAMEALKAASFTRDTLKKSGSAESQITADKAVADAQRLLALKTQELNTQEAMASSAGRLGKTFRDNFQTGLEGLFTSLINNEESSLKESLKKLATSVLKSLGATLGTMITEQLLGITSKEDQMKQAIQDGHMAGMEAWVSNVVNPMVAAAGGTTSGTSSAIPAEGSKVPGKSFMYRLFGERGDSKITTTEEGGDSFTEEKRVFFGGVFSNFLNGIEGLFSGDAPFLQKLGGLFGGLGDMFGNIFGSLFGGAKGGIFSFFAAANGGIAPGGFKAFANGGIVNKPTLGMVGEGKHNEAVVPLPDGKSIPVVGNTANNTNNINVVINAESGNTRVSGDAPNMNQLGKVLGSTVRDQLVKEMRPGGLLSR